MVILLSSSSSSLFFKEKRIIKGQGKQQSDASELG